MTPYQEHLIYMKGWADGAGRRRTNSKLLDQPPYKGGYIQGRMAFEFESEGDAKVRKVNLNEIKAQ